MMLLATCLLMNRICRSTEINKIKSREAHLEPICPLMWKYQFESDKRCNNSEGIKLVLLGVSV